MTFGFQLDLPAWIGDTPALRNLVATGALLVLVILARRLVNGMIRTTEMAPDERRRWMVRTRNAALLAFLVGGTTMWASELQAVAVSLVAMAAALALATKELVMCLTGGILRRRFTIGDRIEVGHHRGDVLDMDPLTTTLLEVGPGQSIHQLSGRAIVLPNSVFLNTPVINESFTEDFVLHVLQFPIQDRGEARAVEERLLAAAQSECAPYLEEARRYFERMAARQGMEAPFVDPRVYITVPEATGARLLLRFPTPARQRGRAEQAILRRILEPAA